MESLQSKIYKCLLRIIASKSSIKNEFAKGIFNNRDCPEPPISITSKYTIETKKFNGRNVFTINPEGDDTKLHIIYFHGGAYIHNMAKPHWTFIKNLIHDTDATITVLDYPLAPKNTCKDSFAMALAVYKELITRTDAKNLVLMGDSAGGGFALSLAQQIRDLNLTQPAQIILLSPWLDVSLTNPEIILLDSKDPFLGIEGLKMAAAAYAGDIELTDSLISPIYGNLKNLGTISVFTGTHDILFADAGKLKNLADKAGIKINYFEYPGMIHVWMLLKMPEARIARRQMVQLLST